MVRRVWLSLLIFSLAGCTAGHRISRLQTAVNPDDIAAYYALPRTVVTVQFPVSKMMAKRGTASEGDENCFDQLDHQAEFLLTDDQLYKAIGLQELPATNPTFVVTGNPVIGSLAEPDPEQIFRVDLSSNWAIKRQVNLVFGPMGVLDSGTSFVQDRRVDLSVAFLKTASNVLVAFSEPPKGPQPAAAMTLACEDVTGACQRAACEIYDARRKNRDLTQEVDAGTLDPKQATWLAARYEQIADENIPKLIQQSVEKATVVCAVRPTSAAVPPEYPMQRTMDLVEFHTGHGFRAASQSDCLIPPGFSWTSSPGMRIVYSLDVDVEADQTVGALARSGVPAAHAAVGEGGFFYRVPAQASVRVRRAMDAIAESPLVIAQLGYVAVLPRRRTYQTKYKVTLDPATGALKTLDAESDSIDPALVTGAGDAIAEALKARQEEEEAEAAARDELALLERERKILEERVKIQEALRKLGESGSPPN